MSYICLKIVYSNLSSSSYIFISCSPWTKNVSHLKVNCSYLHLFPPFSSPPTLFFWTSVTSSYSWDWPCFHMFLLLVQVVSSCYSSSIVGKLQLEAFSIFSARFLPLGFHTKLPITFHMHGNYQLTPAFFTIQEALTRKFWSGFIYLFILGWSTETSSERYSTSVS